MLDYVVFSVIINYLVLICLIGMIYRNKVLVKKQRVGLILSFTLILVVSTIELTSVFIDYKKVLGNTFNIILINFYLALAPLVPILYSGALTGYKHKSFKYVFTIYIFYLIFLVISIPFKLIFFINDNGLYMKSWGYPVFIVSYILFKLYLIYIAFIKIKRFKTANWFSLIILLIAFLVGSGIQLYDPTIHTAWSCLTLILIVYYAYYNELCRQLDEMTNLYSHQAYNHNISNIKPGNYLIIMDCDEFKNLNDTYGHAEGDKCLIAIAGEIKNVFDKYGICYRIGGDEFAVIINKNIDIEEKIKELKEYLSIRRESLKTLPNVSIGYLRYEDGNDINLFREDVDRLMYKNKR